MGTLILPLFVFIFFGLVFGWIAYFRTNKLQREINELKKQLKFVRNSANLPSTAPSQSTRQSGVASSPDNQQSPAASQEKKAEEKAKPATAAISITPQTDTPVSASAQSRQPAEKPAQAPEQESAWLSHLKTNWMVWLGGACVGLAGIFLVKYSIDQGMLGPGARVAMGLLSGLGLHMAAEWLRRTKENHPAFAALAAGGSITLFAALLAALHLYSMLSPTIIFILLAIVALTSMALAVLHGPILAVLGILGAYVIPLLVGGDQGNALTVMLYVLVISASALMLLRYVYRDWLWWGVLAGSLGWVLLTIGASQLDGLRGTYLAILAYLLLAIPAGDWTLQQKSTIDKTLSGWRSWCLTNDAKNNLLSMGLFLLVVFQFLVMLNLGRGSLVNLNWLPLAVLLIFAGGQRQFLCLHGGFMLIAHIAAALLVMVNEQAGQISIDALNPALLPVFYRYSLIAVAVYSGLALFNVRTKNQQGIWIAMGTLAPLCFLTLTYLLTAPAARSIQWSLIATLAGGLYLALALVQVRKYKTGIIPAWLFISAHLGYSLAVSMLLREASLTLALAVQLISLAWVIQRFNLPVLGWMLKVMVALIITRLSLNPWLLSYSTDVHWSLWTYGGATLCCVLAARQLKGLPALQQWAQGAGIHLLALTIWAETRFWLYDGNVYSAEFGLLEATLNLSLFSALGLIYYWREQFSSQLAWLYRIYSQVLLTGAILNYFIIMLATVSSSAWLWRDIGQTPVFNLMLFCFGLPAVWAVLTYRYYLPQYQKIAQAVAVFAAFTFISLEIRHLWQGDLNLNRPTLNAELYTYSIVWLLLAVAAILGGAWRYGKSAYKAGMVLLLVVIAKLFLVDMSDLAGLLRVSSFMGMGLALLAIAYLHKRLQPQTTQNE